MKFPDDPRNAPAKKTARKAGETAQSRPHKAPFMRAEDLLDTVTFDRPDALDALKGPHLAMDGHGRILGVAASVATALGTEPRGLIGRRLVHRVRGTERARIVHALLRLRTLAVFEDVTVRLRRAEAPDAAATFRAVLTIPAPPDGVVVICHVDVEPEER